MKDPESHPTWTKRQAHPPDTLLTAPQPKSGGATDSTAWKTQLTLLAPQLVARLNQDLGPGTVSVIEVVGPHLPTWRKGPRSTRDGRGPRDTYG